MSSSFELLTDFVFAFLFGHQRIRSEESVDDFCPRRLMTMWAVHVLPFFRSGHSKFLLSDHE
jgi:hypothetical protein